MKCDYCESEVPEENIDRVCAYQIEIGVGHDGDYTNYPCCNCCVLCRQKCHEGLFEINSAPKPTD